MPLSAYARLKEGLKSNAGSVFLILILIASLAWNVRLARELKVSAWRMLGVKPDRSLMSVPAIDDNGKQTSIGFAGPRPTVLYILSPSCEWCKRNQANIVALANAERTAYRFVGVSISTHNMKAYRETSTLPFPIYAVTSPQYLKDSGFGDLTPQTVVVSPGGMVMKVWLGAYDRKEQEDVENFFRGVRLPGLLPTASQPGTQKETKGL